MVGIMSSLTNTIERTVETLIRLEECTVVEIDRKGDPGVQCHSPDHPEYKNTVSVKPRGKKHNEQPTIVQHTDVTVLQNFLGNRFGHPYTPRVGDLVLVLFLHNRKPMVLCPINTNSQQSVFRAPYSTDAMYDWVWKWCQWLRPKFNRDQDAYEHPEGKMPVCAKLFHGPVTGKVGKGRDCQFVFDCRKGNDDPKCRDCTIIDSVPRSKEGWIKVYSEDTESCQSPSKRMEIHAKCGSYARFESETGNSVEYSEGKSHIRIGNAVCESDKRFHLSVQGETVSGSDGVGTFDLHTNHEEVPLASESEGVRIAGVRPEDDQVTWSYESIDFTTNSFIRIYKDGKIELNSCNGNSQIILDGTTNTITINGTNLVDINAATEVEHTTPLVHNTASVQTDGTCTHTGCSCPCCSAGGWA
jgi:hypothetical protein